MKVDMLRVSSMILSQFEDNMSLIDMCKLHNTTYTHTHKVMSMIIKEGIITPNQDTVDKFKKRYVLTDKGKLIQSNLQDIIRVIG